MNRREGKPYDCGGWLQQPDQLAVNATGQPEPVVAGPWSPQSNLMASIAYTQRVYDSRGPGRRLLDRVRVALGLSRRRPAALPVDDDDDWDYDS